MLFPDTPQQEIERNEPLGETEEATIESLLKNHGAAVIQKMASFYGEIADSAKGSGRLYDAEFARQAKNGLQNTFSLIEKVPDLD